LQGPPCPSCVARNRSGLCVRWTHPSSHGRRAARATGATNCPISPQDRTGRVLKHALRSVAAPQTHSQAPLNPPSYSQQTPKNSSSPPPFHTMATISTAPAGTRLPEGARNGVFPQPIPGKRGREDRGGSGRQREREGREEREALRRWRQRQRPFGAPRTPGPAGRLDATRTRTKLTHTHTHTHTHNTLHPQRTRHQDPAPPGPPARGRAAGRVRDG